MSSAIRAELPVRYPDRFYIDGRWVEPSGTTTIDVVDSTTEETFLRVAEAQAGDIDRVIPAADEDDAVRIANDTIFGLNASVFTPDVDKARAVAARLRSGTVGHNAFRTDFGMAFGGFKQSGLGREGGREGLLPYLEVKTVILDAVPSGHRG